MTNRVIPANRFSLVFNGTVDIATRDGGYLTFGGWPRFIKLTSAWAITPFLTSMSFNLPWYTIHLDKVTFSTAPNLPAITHEDMIAIVDSGAAFTTFVAPVASALYELMPGEHVASCNGRAADTEKCITADGQWYVPYMGTFPEVSMTLGGMELRYTKENLVVEVPGSGQCIATVKEFEMNILGLSWMKNDLVVLHDFEDGVANLKVATYQ